MHLPPALTATTIWERRYCFLPAFFFRVTAIILRHFGLATGHPESLAYLIKQVIKKLTLSLQFLIDLLRIA